MPDPIPELIPILQAAPSEPTPAPVPPAPAPSAVRKPAAAPPGAAVVAPAPLAAAPPAPAARPPVAAKVPVAAKTPVRSAPVAAPASAAPSTRVADKPAPVAEKTLAAGRVFGDSNVREVLQALGDASATGETRLMRSPPPPREAAAPAAKESLSDTQVLKLLEVRRTDTSEPQPAAEAPQGSIPMLKPDDTGTREALKTAVVTNAPVLFAVQLQWSVQAVELEKVPPLAIFSAYTLYTVEGSRDGRKWYGLRLGFFSDAISAKQVAHYVRSEFAAVAVVPVSAQERARATDQDKQAATLGSAPAKPAERVDEFKLIDDATEAAAAVAKMPQRAAPAKPVADASGRKIPGRPVPKPVPRGPASDAAARPARPAAKGRGRVPGKIGAGESRGAQSLEETLEILGAGQLAMDNGNGETLNESGVRHLRVEVQKGSPFAKLLDRLSERMKKQ